MKILEEGEKRRLMEYVLDIETEVFEKIKNHETVHFRAPALIRGERIKKFDTLKLYHPGEEIEALRIEVVGMEQLAEEQRLSDSGGEDTSANNTIVVEFQLLEWMFQMETELDDLLREEKKWEGLL